MSEKYLTVTQLTKYIKFKIDNDPHLINVFLKGEISNFKAHTRGHLYFTIKDENSRINAVMFQTSARNLNFVPQDGSKVMIIGRVSVYEATGGYQIYVNEMVEDGIGNLYIEFEKLKKKLQDEGLFNEEHKRKIPKFPKRVGVVTAATGAAVRDIITTIKRRWPLTEIILFPSLVQGANAAPDIIKQINLANQYDLDTLIVGRGGGSIEDLWCFNDENVARTIYNSRIPIISGVGHEIDFTIADFVADLRAPTPTAAAELAVPNILDIENYLKQVNIRSYNTIKNKLNNSKKQLEQIKKSFIFENPINIYTVKEERFDNIFEKLKSIMQLIYYNNLNRYHLVIENYIFKNPSFIYENKKNSYMVLIEKLHILNPLNTLSRGYGIIKSDEKIVDSIKLIKENDLLQITVKDGNIKAKVMEVFNGKEK